MTSPLRLATVALLVGSSLAAAQTAPRSTLVVGVGDAATGTYLVGAHVSLTPEGRRLATDSARVDSLGRALFPALPLGRYTIAVRHLGYAPLATPITLASSDTAEVVIMLDALAQRLPTTVVRDGATRDWRPWVAGFEERRRTRAGRFIDEATLQQQLGSTLKSVLEARLPVKIRSGYVVSVRGPNGFKSTCNGLVYVDGVRVASGTIGDIGLAEV